MNSRILSFVLAAACVLLARAEIDVPTDGSDGDLILTDTGTPREVVIDLSLAPTAAWNTPQTQPHLPDVGGVGVYDSAQWAVVFKYNTVRIEKNVTVRFKNHASRAPVVWLVKGNVEIDGNFYLKGESEDGRTAEPGPGGFRGSAWPTFHYTQRGAPFTELTGFRRASPSLVPLIGGVGQGFWGGSRSYGGGGAMLIASRRTLTFNGNVNALGGGDSAGGGSFRMVADELAGSGWIDCYGLRGNPAGGSAIGGGFIRLEANRLTGTLRSRPDSVVVPPSVPPRIWPATNAPTSRIVSVAGLDARLDPLAPLAPHPEGPDVRFQTAEPVRILIETTHFTPSERARVVLSIDSNSAVRTDMVATPVSGGTFELAHWEVIAALPQGYSTLIVNAVSP